MKILWDAANPFMSVPCWFLHVMPFWCLFSTGDVLWLLQGHGCSQELKAHPPDHQDDGVHSESIHSAARTLSSSFPTN